MSFIGILFLSATAVCFSFTSGQKVFYVHPNGDQSQCPVNGGDCYTLNEYFAVSHKSFAYEDTIFEFLPGNHFLNNSINISVSSNITFHGMPRENGLLDPPVVIRCVAENVAITFEFCNNVQFQNIAVRNCGKRVVSLMDFSESALVMFNVLNANIHYVSIQDSPGAALALSDSLNISISMSSFHFNNRYSSYNESASVAVMYRSAQASSISNSALNFVMHHCDITDDHFIGLYISLIEVENLLNIHLESIYVANNTFLNIFIYSVTDKYDLSITALQSAGSLSGVILSQNETSLKEHVPSISIVNCSLSNHQGNGLIVLWYSSLSGLFYLGYSSFTSNAGIIGTALLIAADRNPSSQGTFDVILDNVTFDSNVLNRTFADVFGLNPSISATAGFSNGKNLSIINCTFSNNEGSGLGIFNTYTTFYGVNNFINNSAEIGGGIVMISTSFLFFTPGSLVNFIGNHAEEKGGAINVEQIVLLFSTTEFIFSESNLVINPCFYELDDANPTEKHLHFESNTAGVAGAVLYGGDTSVCIQANFSEISTFFNQEDTFSIISSDPRGVCFCTAGVPNCNQKSLLVSAIPGDSIKFSVVVIGQNDNATTGIISVSSDSQARPNNYNSHAVCTNLTHEIKVQENTTNKVTVNVTIGNFQTNFFQHPLTIDVDIDPCLTGTYLSPISHVCECEESIKAATTNCIGVNATVTKKDIHGWIGNYDNCTIDALINWYGTLMESPFYLTVI
uniref:Right handed beta helix domain-containing protein n=1 Tax=Amphimedon queenslandica TaxID=400682 RepID=A0A1X7V8Y8_AMPQE